MRFQVLYIANLLVIQMGLEPTNSSLKGWRLYHSSTRPYNRLLLTRPASPERLWEFIYRLRSCPQCCGSIAVTLSTARGPECIAEIFAHPPLLLYLGRNPSWGHPASNTLSPMRYQTWTYYLGVCSRLSNRILLSVQSHHVEVPFVTINVLGALILLSYPASGAVPLRPGRASNPRLQGIIRVYKRPRCPAELLPFHMPLCSGVWCFLLIPALRSSTGELSAQHVTSQVHVLEIAAPHHPPHRMELAISYRAMPFILGRWARFTRPKVQLQFVAFSNSAAVGFTFHLTLQSACLGIFIAPFVLGGKPLRYVLLSPARPP